MNRLFKALAGMMMAAALVACGGGGGSPGATPGNPGGNPGGTPGGGTVDPTTLVADFAMFMDKTTITNTGLDSAQLTVVAVDANRNVVAGAAVTTSTDQNSVFVPSGTVTDATGTYTGDLQIGGDKTDREITVAVTVNGIVKRTTVRVSGSRLTLTALPSTPQPGQSVTMTANLKDAAGNPIQDVTLTFGGDIAALRGRTGDTDANGDAVVTFTAPSTAGIYTISATGGGTQAIDYQLQVFATAGAVPVAVIPASVVPSLSASPNVLSVNAVGSQANKATLRFLMLDSANNPVPNVRVRFQDMTTGQPKQGASIATTTTLYTDASGIVTTQYIPGQNSSPTNGVTIRACYSATDFTVATGCPADPDPNSVETTLTVAGQALSVSIGDDNLLEEGTGTYIKRFAVTVADSAGRAVANAPVDISVDLTHYGKGEFSHGSVAGTTTLTLSSVPLDLLASSPSTTTDPMVAGHRVWCANEDTNRNANLDGTEDRNGNGTLEPRKSDLLISYDSPTATRTNSSGILVIKVEYSQRFATWLAYKVRVTANVSGSEGMAERLFVTDFLEADKNNGSFHTPPYGSRRCVDPN